MKLFIQRDEDRLKRLCAFVTAAIMIAVMMIPVAAADAPITVLVNGQKIKFDVEPVITDGRVLVPVRAVSEAFGCKVTWNEKTQTVTIK